MSFFAPLSIRWSSDEATTGFAVADTICLKEEVLIQCRLAERYSLHCHRLKTNRQQGKILPAVKILNCPLDAVIVLLVVLCETSLGPVCRHNSGRDR
jgi:hypothetical protein